MIGSAQPDLGQCITCSGIEVVITGLTRNQFERNLTRVRIPPAACRRDDEETASSRSLLQSPGRNPQNISFFPPEHGSALSFQSGSGQSAELLPVLQDAEDEETPSKPSAVAKLLLFGRNSQSHSVRPEQSSPRKHTGFTAPVAGSSKSFLSLGRQNHVDWWSRGPAARRSYAA